MRLAKFLRDLFTEDDAGTTWCLVRCSGAAVIALTALGFLWAVAKGSTISFLDVGGGFAAEITALGTAIGVKARLGADTVTAAPPAPAPHA